MNLLESDVALNGWHRLLIVIAAAWALAVAGFAAVEYRGSQGEVGDGFFTCWEPTGTPTPPATRFWDRDCGLLPRVWVARGLFDDLPPHRRYLNITRLLAVLLGPLVFFGLSILAACWVVSGFRSNSLRRDSGPKDRRKMPSRDRSDPVLHNHAEAWLDRMPRRWARNSAIGGGLLEAPAVIPLLSKGDGAVLIFMLVGLGVVALCIAGAGYLCGLWARSSLRASFLLSPAAALTRITPNWVSGAILLGVFLLACDVLFGWRRTTPLFEAGVSFGDWGYLIGFFGAWMLWGYLTALVSKRGLRKALAADRRRTTEPDDSSVSFCLPLQTIG